MVELIDTHAHLYLSEFETDLKQVVQKARACGVSRVMLPNIDLNSVNPMFDLCERFPDFFFPMMGFHPCSFSSDYTEVPPEIMEGIQTQTCFGVGEIGLDTYWDKSTLDFQMNGFIKQMIKARDNNLPVSIHCRDAFDLFEKCLDTLTEKHGFVFGEFKGVLHCFTGTVEQGTKAIKAGFFLGIGGVLTYRNSGLAKTIEELPLERMVLETDSPYLSPVPNRGKRNEPAFIRHIAEALASVKNVPLAQVANVTSSNAYSVFFDNRS